MAYIYLASPYSGLPELREERYDAVLHATAWFLNNRLWVYSPIVHCHELAVVHRLPYDFTFWRGYNEAMIEQASSVAVLMLDGWQDSKGINAEIALAIGAGKPIQQLWREGDGYALYEWMLPS